MVRGESDRQEIFRIKFGNDDSPSERIFVEESELERFVDYTPSEEGQVDYFLMWGCRPEDEERVLKESPCLVRQSDGRFKAVNPEERGPVYLIER